MQRILFLTVPFVMFSASPRLSRAEDAASPVPAGTWAWSHDYGQGEVKSLLTLHVKDTQVTGVYYGKDGEVEFKDGSFDGQRVAFQFNMDHDGQPITIKFSGAPKGDELDGTVTAHVRGEAHEFPWKAKRSTRPEDVVGVWKLTIKADNGQTYTPQVKIEKAGTTLSGKYVTQEIGDHELETVSLRDNVLKFNLTLARDGREFKFDYEGKPRGDQMAGKINYDLDGNTGSADFTGELTRAAK